MADYTLESAPFDVDALATTLAESRLLGSSTLTGGFDASRGFAWSLRRDGLPELTARFPFLRPALDRFFRPMIRWHLRRHSLARPLKRPNAFYLNVLEVPAGAGVSHHVDATLRESSGVEGLLPQWVSVLHLRAPSHGGQLELWRGDQCLASLEPRPGRILHFRGELIHGVREVATDSSRSRLSLVCEQYWISHQALNRIPRYRTHSKAGFHALVTPPGS